MPFVVDGPLPDGECWFRVLTNVSHIKSNGRLHHSALKGGGAVSSSDQKPWSHELSGRVVSLAGDATEIARHADQFVDLVKNNLIAKGKTVPTAIAFAGVACSTAIELRILVGDSIQTDAVYTPEIAGDMAHSDFVTYNTTDDSDLEPIRIWLAKTLRVLRPDKIGLLVSSCGAVG